MFSASVQRDISTLIFEEKNIKDFNKQTNQVILSEWRYFFAK